LALGILFGLLQGSDFAGQLDVLLMLLCQFLRQRLVALVVRLNYAQVRPIRRLESLDFVVESLEFVTVAGALGFERL
jgi:hypothetical protein